MVHNQNTKIKTLKCVKYILSKLHNFSCCPKQSFNSFCSSSKPKVIEKKDKHANTQSSAGQSFCSSWKSFRANSYKYKLMARMEPSKQSTIPAPFSEPLALCILCFPAPHSSPLIFLLAQFSFCCFDSARLENIFYKLNIICSSCELFPPVSPSICPFSMCSYLPVLCSDLGKYFNYFQSSGCAHLLLDPFNAFRLAIKLKSSTAKRDQHSFQCPARGIPTRSPKGRADHPLHSIESSEPERCRNINKLGTNIQEVLGWVVSLKDPPPPSCRRSPPLHLTGDTCKKKVTPSQVWSLGMRYARDLIWVPLGLWQHACAGVKGPCPCPLHLHVPFDGKWYLNIQKIYEIHSLHYELCHSE